MQKQQLLYQGKAKSVYKTDNPDYFVMEYRDDTSAFNGQKLEKLKDKGKVNNFFNAHIMTLLAEKGIATHFEKVLNEHESLVKCLKMLPIECVVRNIAAGSLCKRLGVPDGTKLKMPIFEFFYKNDELGDPMINEYHILAFDWATEADIAEMKALTFKINDILKKVFLDKGMLLVDYKLEFGHFKGQLLLGDEFTPDGCRVWDEKTHERLDKDRFRQNLGGVVEAYQLVAERLEIEIPG